MHKRESCWNLTACLQWMILNGHDRDWRDLYLDQRLTNNANK